MDLPQRILKEITQKDLTPAEFRVLVSLYQVANGRGIANVSQEELCDLVRYRERSVRDALRGLEGHGLLETIRKKRNFGKYHRNVYQLVVVPRYEELPAPQRRLEEISENSPPAPQRRSTDSYITSKLTNTNSLVNTPYLLKVRTAHQGKEIRVGKWTDDDDIGGVGLFEEEVQEKFVPKNPNKRDPRTRHQRPNHEWTPADSAAEFGDRLRKQFPGLPQLVNTRTLAMILAKYRKELGTTSLVELDLVNRFFADEKNLSYVARVPEKAMGAFLTLFKTKLPDALESLGMSTPQRGSANQVDRESNFIYASDGMKFENNLVGRKALQLHEERLARSV